MAKLVTHQKQYVLGPKPVRVRSDWICETVSEGLVLSHCPKLAVQRLQSQDGIDFWLLGLAVPADEPGHTIAEIFHSKDSAEIEAWTGFWAGRWLLISQDFCWQDASGSLGVNYREVDGNIWLSSSPALLGKHLPNAPALPRIPWRIAHAKGMDWIPTPFTTREGIYKLLPQRTIDPRRRSIRPVRFVRPSRDLSEDAGVLASALKTVMINWERCDFSQRLVGLTAGLDTRTIMAAARAAAIDMRAVTTSYPFMDSCDRVLPPRLAASIGVPHVFRNLPSVPAEEVKSRSAIISEHLDGATAHPSFDHRALFDHSKMDDRQWTAANGTCFEIGRCFFWGRFANVGLGEARPNVDQILGAFAFQSSWRPEPVEAWRRALERWIDSLSDAVPLAADWRDRFYLDQRLGAWNCNVQRGNDFVEIATFNPANCLWIFYLLLQPDPVKRRDGVAQREAIHILEPRLMRFPINPLPMSERIKRNAKSLVGQQVARKLRSFRNFLKSSPAR
jgi:hypothetical protein